MAEIGLQIPLREEAYPTAGIPPSGHTMSACEVLCWISYRRAIPKKLYYRPLDLASPGLPIDELTRLFHTAIPETAGTPDPMPIAELALMKALRLGQLQAFGKDGPGKRAVKIPVEDFEFQIISTRGGLEPAVDCSDQDYSVAEAEPRQRCVIFLTSEVLSIWPVQTTPNSAVVALDRPRPPPGQILRDWYLRRVETWPSGKPPNEADDVREAKKQFPGVTRKPVRDLRVELAPAGWKAHGRRRSLNKPAADI